MNCLECASSGSTVCTLLSASTDETTENFFIPYPLVQGCSYWCSYPLILNLMDTNTKYIIIDININTKENSRK